MPRARSSRCVGVESRDNEPTRRRSATVDERARTSDSALRGATMQWYGKALGGLIGFILARQVGAVVGVLMGHVVDEDGGKFFRRTLSWLEGLAHEPDPIDNAYRVLGVAHRAGEDEGHIAYRGLMDALLLTTLPGR